MRYFISAGEASGDLHAAELIENLRILDPKAEFTFLGGDLMSAAAGTQPLIHYRDMAYMGFADVVAHLPQVLRNMTTARRALTQQRPDALIIVDYPSFNLRLAEAATKLDIPVFAYISPKVWAWKEHRVKKMKKLITRLYSILPFEPEYFARKDFRQVMYVGNPSLEEVDRKLARCRSAEEFRIANRIADSKPILALVPGSRMGEIRSNLSIMLEVASRHPEYHAVVAAAPGIDPKVYDNCGATVISGQTFELMRHAHAALVTSGTATLECALAGTPQVACYRANGSRIAYEIFKRILKIPFVTLPNLITRRQIIPEMLVYLCTADRVDAMLTPLLSDNSLERRRMIEDYGELRQLLGDTPAAATAAKDIYKTLTL